MNTSNPDRLLLIAVGNSGRQDDGLGWAFADALPADFPGDIEYRYQLQVEDAELIRQYDRVLFVDADRSPDNLSFTLRPLRPAAAFQFSTHALDAGSVLFLCEELYNRRPDAWLLGVRGYAWELACGLTPGARRNLQLALDEVLAAFHSGPQRGRAARHTEPAR